ncbi:hydrogen peroxide-inducible genes activator [Pararhizobium mangrovi]|nr:hydrogen peroxide-inducible genes activator [Pararhizobium mangrovi]
MRYFDALATTLNFRRAAEAVHVSQPALSAQIHELERHFGAKLVSRSRGASELTAEGARVLPRIRAILGEIDALEASVGPSAAHDRTVRLGMIPTVAPYLVATLLPRLRGDEGAAAVELKESVTANLLTDLRGGRLDAAIVALPIEDASIAVRPLVEDRFVLAGAANLRAGLAPPVRQEAIDPGELLLLEEGHCLRDQALSVCSLADDRRLVGYGATSMSTLVQMVAHGMGLTLLPEIAVAAEGSRHALAMVRFADPQPARTLALAWRRGSHGGPFEALAETIAESARSVIADGAEWIRPQEA